MSINRLLATLYGTPAPWRWVLSGTELNQPGYVMIIQKVVALAAALFGLVTIIAGARVLTGSDPGYVVFRPLLIYNTAMGVAYVAAGIVAWHSIARGKIAAAAIFGLNFLVLAVIGFLYTTGGTVAIVSLGAMTLRTVAWFLLFLGLAWVDRRNCR